MATKKTTSVKKTAAPSRKASSTKSTSQKVSAPKKSTRRKANSEMTASEMDYSDDRPKTRIITRKYLYAVLIVLALVGVLFAASRLWVVAWVDNKPVTKFELYTLLEKRDEGKTTDELIQQKLLASEGKKQGVAVSVDELEAEIKKVEEQQGGAAQLDQVLAANRLSREDFRMLVELNLLKQKLFGKDVNITDADVAKYLEENKDSLPPDIMKNPESSEAAKLRESAKEQLKQMKVNANFNKWLEEAMSSSRVSRSVPAPTPTPAMMPPTAPNQNP